MYENNFCRIGGRAPSARAFNGSMTTRDVLIDGAWRPSAARGTFRATSPLDGALMEATFPTSSWEDCDRALDAAAAAAEELRATSPDVIAAFLERCAGLIEERGEAICAVAHRETALPVTPRLAEIELPRTTGQLRKAAEAARRGDWAQPTIDTGNGDTAASIRSHLAPIGPVVVFGPNNFPLAFGAVSGGDFAAAVAAGNPVIAKGHPLHPETTRLLAECAADAASEVGYPARGVQLLHDLDPADGLRLVADGRVGASAFTGSKAGGLALKAAADAAGRPIYLELGSVNPTYVLGGALAERGDEIAAELAGSCLLGTGQFCTNPGLVLAPEGEAAEAFLGAVAARFDGAPAGPLFSAAGRDGLHRAVAALRGAGATVVTGGDVEPPAEGAAFRHQNTLLRARGADFVAAPDALQTEAFGGAMLVVTTANDEEMLETARHLHGSLTGGIVAARSGADDDLAAALARVLRPRVGRLLDGQMPTGVAVSPAMNHGGPFPSSGHPGFTAVGIPASLRRFGQLECYDNVRAELLPEALRDANPRGTWRLVDGDWSRDPVA